MLSCIRPTSWSAQKNITREGQHAQGQKQGHSQPEGPPDLILTAQGVGLAHQLDTPPAVRRWRW